MARAPDPRCRDQELLDRLAQGPLPLDEPGNLAASSASLRVRICKLRNKGHRIVSVPLDRPRGRVGKAPVAYVLEQ